MKKPFCESINTSKKHTKIHKKMTTGQGHSLTFGHFKGYPWFKKGVKQY